MGILEIVDLFVVNKVDCDGSGCIMVDLKYMSSLAMVRFEWEFFVLKTVAVWGEGIDDLIVVIEIYQQWLSSSGRFYDHSVG